MKIVNKRLILALSALIVAGVAAVSVLSFVARGQRAHVQQELRKLLGTDVSFETVEAGLWDGFGFAVKEFRIADDSRFAATPFVQAQELRLGMSLWHLLLGRFVITSLTFTRPELQIITNEDGLLNVTALTDRKRDLVAFPRLRTPAADRKNSGLSFLITRLKIIDGRIDFIDRSITDPAELQIRKIDLDLGELDVSARAKIKLAASLDAAVGQDVRMEGEVGPFAVGKDWAQQPVHLDMEFDSLYLPLLARAIPFFRDRIPRELDITGPMYFHTRVTGTLQQPRFTSITLKVPFLGSSDYNAILEGRAELVRDGHWSDAPIEGKLTLSEVSLPQLRKLPFMRQILSDDLGASGTIDIRSRFAGTWNQLRLGALLVADGSELHYPGGFQKRQGEPAQFKAQLTAQNGGYELHPSELRLGTLKVLVSARLSEDHNRRLSANLKTSKSPVKPLGFLLAPSSLEPAGGNVDWDLRLERDLDSVESGWEIRGMLNLDQVALRQKDFGKTIDRLTGSVSFLGRHARANNVSFRVGSTAASVSLEVSDINSLRARYSLRSDNLAFADLPFFAKPAGLMKNALSSGEVSLAAGMQRLRGVLTSSAGIFNGVAYRDLQTDIGWSPQGISFTDLRIRAFGGELRAGGSWQVVSGQIRELRILPQIDAASLNELLVRMAPQIKDRFGGEVDFHGQFAASAPAGGGLWETLTGSGAAVIRKGTIKDFNLMARLFYRTAGQEQLTTEALPQALAAALQREDTPVQELKVTVTLKAQRLRAESFSLSTSEYTISGVGSVAFDGTVEGKGLLVVSPAVSKELQREYGAIRYFLDRKGRLALSFRLDGKFPNVRVRPENRALAQALRWGAGERGDDLPGRKRPGERTWLPESLERLLHR